MNFKWRVLRNENWTPQNVFFRYAQADCSVLLESAQLHSQTGRYSILGLAPTKIFQARGLACELKTRSKTARWQGNPLTFLQEELRDWKNSADLSRPPFAGGAIGFLGYPAAAWTEPIAWRKKPTLNLPDICFLFFDWALVLDHLTDKWILVGKEEAQHEMEEMYRQLSCWNPNRRQNEIAEAAPSKSEWQSNFTEEEFCRVVERAGGYIAAGDIFQANLSQRLCFHSEIPSQKLYEALTQTNPAPFAAYFKTPDFQLLSSSPERLFSLRGGVAQTRPIAGTRPRAADRREDEALARELILSEKERAEHIMLLDLERNDLGRVCEYHSIEVTEFLQIENYAKVRHLVSNVRGKLAKDKGAVDLLKALFPGGTITGAPKVRAMEIIDELETVDRNVYTGSLGYFSYTGEADFNILIRSFIKQGRRLYLSVGAGIVADSQPQKEYEETRHKAEALIQALESAATRRQHGSYSLLER